MKEKQKSPSQPLDWEEHASHLKKIAEAAIAAVDPFEAVVRHLQLEKDVLRVGDRRYALKRSTRVVVVGAGKAAVAMGRAAESSLGDRLREGLLAVPHLQGDELKRIRLIVGGHPLPTQGSIEAGEAIQGLLAETREDIVLTLISGGGSALLELPLEGLELQDLQRTNELLIKSGATIQEINVVRRQLSRVKGGGLARMAAPRPTIALILSDVVGDDLEAIASGPTVLSETTAKGAVELLKRYQLWPDIPQRVQEALQEGLRTEATGAAPGRMRVDNFLIGSNLIAAQAAARQAEQLGFEALLLTTHLKGEAREVGRVVAALVKGIATRQLPISIPACIVLGGETTVTVRGDGLGGRNQELALAAAIELARWEGVAVMTLATDGVDGPTPAAGAIIHGGTLEEGRSLGLDARSALDRNDSHTFFDALGAALQTGPSGTNVNDLVVCLVYRDRTSR